MLEINLSYLILYEGISKILIITALKSFSVTHLIIITIIAKYSSNYWLILSA